MDMMKKKDKEGKLNDMFCTVFNHISDIFYDENCDRFDVNGVLFSLKGKQIFISINGFIYDLDVLLSYTDFQNMLIEDSLPISLEMLVNIEETVAECFLRYLKRNGLNAGLDHYLTEIIRDREIDEI